VDFLSRTQVIAALGAVGLALFVLELVRRRKLSEDFSFLWLVCSAAIAVLGFSTPLLRGITRALGIRFESSMVFAAGVAFAVAMLLYLSVRLSRLAREQAILARELALLRREREEAARGAARSAEESAGGGSS
jgi:hypothetical protein